MGVKRQTTKSNHSKIKLFFDKLHEEKEEILGKKVRVFTYEICLYRTANQFDKSPKTIENIINNWGEYRNI